MDSFKLIYVVYVRWQRGLLQSAFFRHFQTGYLQIEISKLQTFTKSKFPNWTFTKLKFLNYILQSTHYQITLVLCHSYLDCNDDARLSL